MSFNTRKIIRKLPFSQKTKNFITRLLNPGWLYFLRSTNLPISNQYGFDRGIPADRFYIEGFLGKNKGYILGRCLEIREGEYTRKYGKDNVTHSDVLDIKPSNEKATIIDDLRHLTKIPDENYDCIILTQTLQFIDDVDAAILQCYRVLRKGGVLLATLPSLSRIDREAGLGNDYWRFTEPSARHIFEKKFKPENLMIESKGNVRTGIYFYAGLSEEEISKRVYKNYDPFFPMIVTVRAIK